MLVWARAATLRGGSAKVVRNRYGNGRSEARAMKGFTLFYQRSRNRPSAAPKSVVRRMPALYQIAMKVGVLSVQ